MAKVKYLGDESTGTGFETGETVEVVVTSEAVDPVEGFEGDTPIEYTAIVKDNRGAPEAIPDGFTAKLYCGATLVYDITFNEDVYDPITYTLTLNWTVPAETGSLTVKISWIDQVYDTVAHTWT